MPTLKEDFERECVIEIELVKLFIPTGLQEGTILNLQSCYIKGMSYSTKAMNDVLNPLMKGGEKE